jgi:hemerythrin-like domain-containing protein
LPIVNSQLADTQDPESAIGNRQSAILQKENQVSLNRRDLITGISIAGVASLVAACRRQGTGGPSSATNDDKEQSEDTATTTNETGTSTDVSAVEDLMREHGILRRALLVYSESAVKLRENPGAVPLEHLEKAAQLFRAFGEDYHEKKLEEAFIFPALKKTQTPATAYVDVLLAQHVRGREITDYILAITKEEKLPAGSSNSFITALESFVRMYEHHAAIEDTIIFPAWKGTLKENDLDELSAKFEEIEDQTFGEDGFGAALTRIAEIENGLGWSNLGMFTAAAPPVKS